jgi:hypothetical protein
MHSKTIQSIITTIKNKKQKNSKNNQLVLICIEQNEIPYMFSRFDFEIMTQLAVVI